MEERFFTVNEFARILKISTQMLRKKISKGEIKAFKLTNSPKGEYRIPFTELKRLTAISYEEEE